MQQKFAVPGLLVLLLCSALLSCEKPDVLPGTADRNPPKILASSPYPVVGSNIDSLVLESAPDYTYENKENPFSKNWKTEWKCQAKPDGAPDPVIMLKTERTAYASSLVPGDYQFEVSYSTNALTRKASVGIKVVPAKEPGTVIVADRVNWKLLEDRDWNGTVVYVSGFWSSDQEHFYYGGKSKRLGIEFRDPVTNQWKQLSQPEADITNAQQGSANINYTFNSLSIIIDNGLTPDFLQAVLAKPPAVRLTYP